MTKLHLRRSLRPFPLGTTTHRLSSLTSSAREEENEDLPRAIARLVNSRSADPLSPDLDSVLSHLAPRLTPATLLRSLDLVRPPSAALPLFQWATRHLSLAGDHRPAAKTLHLLLRSRDLRPASDFLHSSPIPLPDHSFNALIRAHARSGRLRDAVALFNQMPALGVAPSAFSYNAIISALLRRGRTRSAAHLFDQMLRSGVAPDTCTFNTLIRGFCLNSMIDEGFRFFREMSRRGVCPDVVTYNTLLDGLCRASKVLTARNLLDGMRSKSPDIAPNVVSYTTLIRGYCGKLQHADAVALFNKMVDAGLEPNRVTYNTLVQGLCKAKKMDLVKDILERASFRPDTCTFNTLIAAHCNSGGVGDALKVFERMSELHVKPDSATYSTLIRGLCEDGEFGRAEKLVDELLEKGVLGRRGSCVPLIAAYNPIFNHLCRNGKVEKATRVFQELMERKAKVDVVAFKTLILGHCKEDSLADGYKLLSSMVRRDLKPDIETFEALIEGFLAKEKSGFAWKALEKMCCCGHRPRTSTFHGVLVGLLKKDGGAEEAGNLVILMLERKIHQNIDLSTDVIASLLRNGSSDRAFEIVGLLYDHGYHVKMEKLVGDLCEGCKILEAWKLLLFCLEKHKNLDSQVYGMVVNGLCRTGGAIEAFELFYEMTDRGIGYDISGCLDNLKSALEATGRLREADFVSKQMSCTGIRRP